MPGSKPRSAPRSGSMRMISGLAISRVLETFACVLEHAKQAAANNSCKCINSSHFWSDE